MAGWFLKLKKISGGDYVYLCRNYREDGAHRREQVYLGRRDPAWFTLEDVRDSLGKRHKALPTVRRVLRENGNVNLRGGTEGVGPKGTEGVGPKGTEGVGPKGTEGVGPKGKKPARATGARRTSPALVPSCEPLNDAERRKRAYEQARVRIESGKDKKRFQELARKIAMGNDGRVTSADLAKEASISKVQAAIVLKTFPKFKRIPIGVKKNGEPIFEVPAVFFYNPKGFKTRNLKKPKRRLITKEE